VLVACFAPAMPGAELDDRDAYRGLGIGYVAGKAELGSVPVELVDDCVCLVRDSNDGGGPGVAVALGRDGLGVAAVVLGGLDVGDVACLLVGVERGSG